MALSCDPATIVAAAKCFECIPRNMQRPVELYLLARTAGVATDSAGVAALVAAAKCFDCVPHSVYEQVEEYLLAQIGGCQ